MESGSGACAAAHRAHLQAVARQMQRERRACAGRSRYKHRCVPRACRFRPQNARRETCAPRRACRALALAQSMPGCSRLVPAGPRVAILIMCAVPPRARGLRVAESAEASHAAGGGSGRADVCAACWLPLSVLTTTPRHIAAATAGRRGSVSTLRHVQSAPKPLSRPQIRVAPPARRHPARP